MDSIDAPLATLLSTRAAGVDATQVAGLVADTTMRTLHPDLVALHAEGPDGLDLRSSHGLRPLQRRALAHIRSDLALPWADVARTGAPSAVVAASLRAHFPLIASLHLPSEGALLLYPVTRCGRVTGVLSAHVPSDGQLTPQEHARVQAGCAALALWLATTTAAPPAPGVHGSVRITERQRRVLAGVRRGLTNAAIAAELGFAVGTIKADITAMSALLRASGRVDLMHKAERAGL